MPGDAFWLSVSGGLLNMPLGVPSIVLMVTTGYFFCMQQDGVGEPVSQQWCQTWPTPVSEA